MPPERFVVVKTFPDLARNASLCSRPVSKIPPKPEPISNAFDAGRLNIAFAKSASRSEEHTSELQSLRHIVCRLLPEKNTILQRLQPSNHLAYPLEAAELDENRV